MLILKEHIFCTLNCCACMVMLTHFIAKRDFMVIIPWPYRNKHYMQGALALVYHNEGSPTL